MSLLNSIQSDASVDTSDKDVLGGRTLLATNLYEGKIEAAWLSAAGSGAIAFNYIAKIGATSLRQTVYITNKDKQDFFVDKKTQEKKIMPGAAQINSLVKLLTGKNSLKELGTEQRVLSLYDYDAKKEMPTKVDAFVDLHGRAVLFAVEHQIVDKSVKGGDGKYVASGETREQNEITKFFDADTRQTATEKAGAATAEFATKWLEKNADKVIDKESKESKALRASGNVVKTGLPSNSAPAPAAADIFGD